MCLRMQLNILNNESHTPKTRGCPINQLPNETISQTVTSSGDLEIHTNIWSRYGTAPLDTGKSTNRDYLLVCGKELKLKY